MTKAGGSSSSEIAPPPGWIERFRVKKNIAFIKTHKTASSALRHVLERYGERYGLKSLFKLEDGARQGLIPEETLQSLEPPYQLSTRHLRYDPQLFEQLIRRPIYVTLVREPLDRMYSHFHYLNPEKDQYRDFDDWYLNRDESNTIVSKGFDNYLATWLGYADESEITRENLDSRFALIGVQERFHESLVLLSRVLNCPPEILWHEPVRVNSKKPPKEISEEVRTRFREKNGLDYRLYQLSNELLEERIASYGADFQKDCERLQLVCERAVSIRESSKDST